MMVAGADDYDPGFDELECRGWNVRQVFVTAGATSELGGDLDGMQATRRRRELRLVVYQGCEGVYSLRGSSRFVPTGLDWMGVRWSVEGREGRGWKEIAGGPAATVLAAATEAEAKARELEE